MGNDWLEKKKDDEDDDEKEDFEYLTKEKGFWIFHEFSHI